MKMNKTLCILLTLGLTLMTACKKEEQPTINDYNALLLNEGNFGSNDASLSGLDLVGGISNEVFSTKNGRGLGSIAQDIQKYGSKVYVVMNESHTVEVMDVNCNSIKQISLAGKGPRYIAFEGGKAYVSCYDHSIVKIDTSSLSVESTCTLTGMKPEGLTIQNGKLWVVHGWETTDVFDSTLSIVNLNTFTEEQTLVVGLNPNLVKNLNNNEIVITCKGNYGNTPASLTIVNTQTLEVRKINTPVENFDIQNGMIYGYESSYSYESQGYTINFKKINPTNGDVTPILQDYANTFTQPYCISINPKNGDFLISNSPWGSLGDLYCIDANGNQKWKVETGFFPSKILYL